MSSKYSYDKCYELAKQCNTKQEFRVKYNGAYQKSFKEGWIKDYWWLKHKTKMTKQSCIEIARKCENWYEFRTKYNQYYEYCKRREHNWLKEIKECVFGGKDLKNKLSYEYCKSVAMKCRTKVEFRKKCETAYKKSLNEGWINDFGFEKAINSIHYSNDYVVYSYEDKTNKYVYVGLTYLPSRRDRDHRFGIKHKHGTDYSVVYRHFNAQGMEIPKMHILMDELDAVNAQYHEDWYRKQYEKCGWKILNVGPTGIGKSSLGGNNKLLSLHYGHN